MNWGKVAMAGVASGIAVSVYNFLVHGMIMAATYEKYAVFTKEEANPIYFVFIAVVIGLCVAAFFAKTRKCWDDGPMGGVVFGCWLGIAVFFAGFINPLVLEGFPYFLSWCWGTIYLIQYVLYGAVCGAIIKK